MDNKQFRKLLKLIEGSSEDRLVFLELTKKKMSDENFYELDKFYMYHVFQSQRSDVSNDISDFIQHRFWGNKGNKIRTTKWYKKWKNEQNI